MVPLAATEKILSDTTGNRSRDRPTSSAVLNANVGIEKPLLFLLLIYERKFQYRRMHQPVVRSLQYTTVEILLVFLLIFKTHTLKQREL